MRVGDSVGWKFGSGFNKDIGGKVGSGDYGSVELLFEDEVESDNYSSVSKYIKV